VKALAFSNNDIALIAWTYDKRLNNCLGFAVYRCAPDKSSPVALPALARFKSTPVNAKLTTEQAPIQKFWWKDLGAKRGESYCYKIVPLAGKPGALTSLEGEEPLFSNVVTVTHERGLFKAYFNRGLVATQAVVQQLGAPDAQKLLKRVADPNDKLRAMLMGELYAGVTSLLDRADANKDNVQAALYELNDPKGLEVRLQAKDKGDPKSREVILGNEWETDENTKESTPDKDAENRQNLKDAGVPVIDRIVPKNQIPHNKFMILFEGNKPQAVLSGSTNWTSSGLAAQANNALVIESPKVAAAYADYWQQLKTDTENAKGNGKALQSKGLRTWDHQHNDSQLKTPIALEDRSAELEVMFSPNTNGLLSKNPKMPNDMGRLFELVQGAKQAILFLAFDPGNNSILDAAGKALKDNPGLFVRGALTNAQRAENFEKALKGPGDQQPGDGGFEVAVVGEPGKPTTQKGKGATGNKPAPEIDYRAIPAGQVTKTDMFGAWEAELYKAGYAIIHDKIVVIDPFSDNCVVITGSHNLGYRASHNNDENMVIIRGHRPLAEAYACHVLDIYDHYAWRYWLRKNPKMFGRPLDETDQWQDRYIKGPDEKSPELHFWLSAASAGAAAPAPRKPAAPAPKRKRAKAA
jgi:phosphatidylserine/phosphatidylglycerophosphate/cardiolipin synthase-like enzyme